MQLEFNMPVCWYQRILYFRVGRRVKGDLKLAASGKFIIKQGISFI